MLPQPGIDTLGCPWAALADRSRLHTTGRNKALVSSPSLSFTSCSLPLPIRIIRDINEAAMPFLKRTEREAQNAAELETSASPVVEQRVTFMAIYLGLVASIGGFMFGMLM